MPTARDPHPPAPAVHAPAVPGGGRLLLLVGLVLATLAASAAEARAGGLLVPEAPVDTGAGRAWQLQSMRVRAHARGPVADVTVMHVFRNASAQTLQADFAFPLPPGAEVSRPILRFGERVLPGTLLRTEAARAAWTADLERLHDTRLVQHLGTDVYRARLPRLASGARAEIAFSFELVLPADVGLTHFVCPLGVTPSVEVVVDLETTAPLGPIYSPSHEIQVDRSTPSRAQIHFTGPSTVETPHFDLFWGTTRGRVGATLLTYWPPEAEEGYYLVMAAPTKPADPQAAHRAQSLTFVVDTSGSMVGSKLEGVREALHTVIRELGPEDHFNVIAYSSEVAALWKAPHRATPEARDEARGFLHGLLAKGQTNTEGALRAALTAPRPPGKPSVVVFLTDGRPTEGETEASKILESIARVNSDMHTRIYVLGVGVDVHAVMLDRLALENGGVPSFVPSRREDIKKALVDLCARIRYPVLTDVTFQAKGMGVTDRLAPKLPDLFQDGALVLSGRYRDGGPVELVLGGRDGGLEREYHFVRTAAKRGQGLRSDFPARVWATRRIAALVDGIRLYGSRSPDWMRELVRLSTEYGVLTEYTAFLAEETCVSCTAVEGANTARARQNILEMAPRALGPLGLAQSKGQVERRGATRLATRTGTWGTTHDGRAIQRNESHRVHVVGNRTFFYRGSTLGWIQALLDPTEPPDATIVRWSPAFFALLQMTTHAENARLAQPGRLLVEVQGRILRIVDPS